MLPRRGCLAASKMGPRGRGRSNFGYFGGIPSPPLWRPQTHQKPPFRHLRPGSTMYTQELSANVSGCPDSPRVGWTCEVLGSPMARGKTEGRGTRVFPCEVSFVRTAPSGALGSLRPLGLGFLTLPERAPEANLELQGGGFGCQSRVAIAGPPPLQLLGGGSPQVGGSGSGSPAELRLAGGLILGLPD